MSAKQDTRQIHHQAIAEQFCHDQDAMREHERTR